MSSAKRILKDYHILDTNKDELNKRNVYYHINQDNLYTLKVLIIADEEPYKGGAFLFEFTFPQDYPLMPPKVIFNPKQNYVRLHPNFYEGGKVCLSMINTWGGEDWTPCMSILSVINVLEARFDNKSICYEPGMEKASVQIINNNNEIVKYGKYLTLCDILEKKFEIYNIFYDIIKDYHKDTIGKIENIPIYSKQQAIYHHSVEINYSSIKYRLSQIYQ